MNLKNYKNEPEPIETAIAQFVIRNVKPTTTMCNSGALVEFMVAMGVRYGYMLAMSQMNIFTAEKKRW